jgi:hypothetical protein
MASFTDTQPIQFNPYIQQLPVDEYMRSGMMKQQRYDEGVQQIHGYINTIGGLPVVGDANKAIITEKMGQLRTALQGVSGADFGKMNLQMDIGNMAAQIAKDPAIMNSVEAARRIQSLEASIAESKKSGKGYSAANEAHVRKYVNDYVSASNKEAGLAFNGPSSLHSVTEDDVHKKWQEAIKMFKGSENIKVSVDDSTGRVMVKSTDKTIDADRIQAALQSVTTADDMKALHIAGWYKTQGASDEKILNSANQYYHNIVKDRQSYADIYRNAANSTEGLTDDQKREYLILAKKNQDTVDQYKSLINKNIENYKSGKFDREDVAGYLNYENMINGYSGAYNFSQKDEERKVSPEFEVNTKLTELTLRARELEAKEKENNESTLPFPGYVNYKADPDNTSALTTDKIQDAIGSTEEIAQKMALQTMSDLITGAPDWSLKKDDPNSPVNKNGNIKGNKLSLLQNMASEVSTDISKATADPDHKVVPSYNTKFGTTLNRKRDVEFLNKAYKTLEKNVRDEVLASNPKLAGLVEKRQEVVTLENGTKITLGEVLDIFAQGTRAVKGVGGGSAPSNPYTTRETVKGSRLDQIGRDKIVSIINKYKVSERDLYDLKDEELERIAKIQVSRAVPFDVLKTQKDAREYASYRGAVITKLPIAGITKDVNDNKIDLNEAYLSPDNVEIVSGRVNDIGRTEFLVQIKTDKDKGQQVWVDMSDYVQSRAMDQNSWVVKYLSPDSNPEMTRAVKMDKTGSPFNEKDGFTGSKFTTNPHAMRNYKIDMDQSTGEFYAVVAVPQKTGGFIYKQIRPNAFNAGQVEKAINGFYNIYNPQTSQFKSLSEWETDFYNRGANVFNFIK